MEKAEVWNGAEDFRMERMFTFLLTIKGRNTVYIGYWHTARVTTMLIPPSHNLGPGVLYLQSYGLRHGLPLCLNIILHRKYNI